MVKLIVFTAVRILLKAGKNAYFLKLFRRNDQSDFFKGFSYGGLCYGFAGINMTGNGNIPEQGTNGFGGRPLCQQKLFARGIKPKMCGVVIVAFAVYFTFRSRFA